MVEKCLFLYINIASYVESPSCLSTNTTTFLCCFGVLGSILVVSCFVDVEILEHTTLFFAPNRWALMVVFICTFQYVYMWYIKV